MEQQNSKVGPNNDPSDRIVQAVEASLLQDKKLASRLLVWAIQPIDHISNLNNWKEFRKMKAGPQNQVADQTVALLCVFQYGYMNLNALPLNRAEGTIKSYESSEKRWVWDRANNLLDFLEANQDLISNTPLGNVLRSGRQEFITNNLFDKIDGYKKKAAQFGIFEVFEAMCSMNCNGVYWGHYKKLNQVTDELKEAADKNGFFLLSAEQLKYYNDNADTLYDSMQVIMEKSSKMMEAAAKRKRKFPG